MRLAYSLASPIAIRIAVAFWRKGDMLDGCGSIRRGVLTLFASAASAGVSRPALGVVVVE
jgi:hypothetical protein